LDIIPPPPPSKDALAALTIASTCSDVMSPRQSDIMPLNLAECLFLGFGAAGVCDRGSFDHGGIASTGTATALVLAFLNAYIVGPEE